MVLVLRLDILIFFVLLSINVIPFLNGSVFDCLIQMEIICGLCKLSTATSLYDKCTDSSKDSWVGIVNSLQWRNPKNTRQQAAHSIIWLYSLGESARLVLI